MQDPFCVHSSAAIRELLCHVGLTLVRQCMSCCEGGKWLACSRHGAIGAAMQDRSSPIAEQVGPGPFPFLFRFILLPPTVTRSFLFRFILSPSLVFQDWHCAPPACNCLCKSVSRFRVLLSHRASFSLCFALRVPRRVLRRRQRMRSCAC